MRTRPPASLDRVVIAAFAIVTTVVIGKTLLQLLAYYPYGVDLDTKLGYVQRAYAGGVTTNVWHGYSYRYGAGTVTWPGCTLVLRSAGAHRIGG